MSDHIVPAGVDSAAVAELALTALGAGRGYTPQVQPDGSAVISFTPDLTPAEVATFDVLVRLAASTKPMSIDKYNAVRTEMQTLRALRQMGRNAFMALSAAERDRMTYDALVSQTIIDLAILRDE